MMQSYYEQVYAIARQIPRGKVTSYGRIAQMLLKPHGARAVGYALRGLLHLRDDPDYDDVPWQRVVAHNGQIRVARRGEEVPLQVELLREEGVRVESKKGGFQVLLKEHLWEGLSGARVDALLDALEAEDS